MTTAQERQQRWPRRWLALALGTFLAWQAPLCAGADRPGFFVRYAATELRDEVYYLTAEADLNLTAAVVEALESGVSLPLELEIEVINPRNWVWDETVYALRQRYRLKFHALTGQYVVTNLNSRVQSAYSARRAALAAVGTIEDLPMLDRSALAVGRAYQARLRARLAVEELPSPLRVWAYISSEWDLVSAWYRWPLQ